MDQAKPVPRPSIEVVINATEMRPLERGVLRREKQWEMLGEIKQTVYMTARLA